MTPQPPAAVLWDMDGTLVDTEPYWIQAETDLVRSYGGEWTHEDAMGLVGAGLWDSAETLRRRGVDMDADAIVFTLTDAVQRRLETEGAPFRPGAAELLRSLRAAGVRTALVTMSVRRMAEQIVSRIPFDAFDLLVTGDEVARPKPDPEPYLAAARALGVDIADCIAIEDSRTGVASAIASGARVVAVPHAVSIEPGSTHTVWPTLAARGIHDLFSLPIPIPEPRS